MTDFELNWKMEWMKRTIVERIKQVKWEKTNEMNEMNEMNELK